MTNFKYYEPAFYALLFDRSEEELFEIPPGHMKVNLMMKPADGAP